MEHYCISFKDPKNTLFELFALTLGILKTLLITLSFTLSEYTHYSKTTQSKKDYRWILQKKRHKTRITLINTGTDRF